MLNNDEIKSKLTTAYLMFVFDFSDPYSVKKEDLEAKMPCPVVDLFSTQKNCDRAKKQLRKEFNLALSHYFARFQSQDGFDAHKLDQCLSSYKKTMVRHLGKDKFTYLQLLVDMMKLVSVKKKGLLAS